MKLFAKHLLSWNEPCFFVVRMRTRSDWTRQGIWMLLASLLMSAGMIADHFWGKGPGRNMSIPVGILVAVAIGSILVLIHDLVWFQRQITINDDSISYLANAGTIASTGSIPLKKISSVAIQRPAELGWPFGLLIVHSPGGPTLYGIPRKLREERLAQVFYKQGIQVFLAGWSPDADSPAAIAKLHPVEATGMAQIQSFDVNESERALNRNNLILCNVLALIPLILSLIGAIALWVYAWWKSAELDWVTIISCVVGGMMLLGGMIGLIATYGELLPSLIFRRILRNRIFQRPDSIVSPDDAAAWFIEVIPRQNWGKLMMSTTTEAGFLALTASEIRFEGDSERWQIPFDSLLGCEVEKVLAPGNKDDETGTYYFYTVLKAQRTDDVWEAPVTPAQVNFEAATNLTRERKSHRLRNALLEQMPDPLRTTFVARQPMKFGPDGA